MIERLDKIQFLKKKLIKSFELFKPLKKKENKRNSMALVGLSQSIMLGKRLERLRGGIAAIFRTLTLHPVSKSLIYLLCKLNN